MSDTLRRTLTSPVAYFLATGLVVVAVVVVVSQLLAEDVARDEALADARATTLVLARSVAEQSVTRGLVEGEAGSVDRFDRDVLDRLLVGDVRRVKIWDRGGTVVWSDEARLIGEDYELDEGELAVLEGGGTEAEVSDLSGSEHRYEPSDESMVEVYTQITAPGGEPLLFESYFSADQIEERQAELVAPFRAITLGAVGILVLVATTLILALTRQLTRGARERERLLVKAAEASDAERRRIARDLHDGVVQDLAGTSFRLSALAGALEDADQREQAVSVAETVRTSMRSLRSLLVEIHPPGLSAADLPGALQDLTAGASDAGVQASVRVGHLDGVGDDAVALVWRVAQEATRNAMRHADARRLDVSVTSDHDGLELTVTDDGTGFDPSTVPSDSFGLRGLASLASDHGGDLEVTSVPGEGTSVRLRVRP
ncbi:MAG TPA: sensor histidine kinase [Nocardioides sp.]|nr:sensor histidine kinase [Nocardioides sp.]